MKFALRALLALLLCAAVLALNPHSALASGWIGTGPMSMSSTPQLDQRYGPCTGSGTMSATLSGDASSGSATISYTLTSVSDGCFGDYQAGSSGSLQLSGPLGDSFSLSDSAGDTAQGALGATQLSLTLNLAPQSPCSQFCNTTLTSTMTGSGDFAGGGSSGGSSTDSGTGTSDSSSQPIEPDVVIAAAAGVFGLGVLGSVALSGAPGRAPVSPGKRDLFGGYGRRGAKGGRNLSSATTTETAIPPPQPPVAAPPFIGSEGGGTALAPTWTPPPPGTPPVWVSVIHDFIALNGVPLNPNFGDRAQVRPDPNDGRPRYWDQHSGQFFNAWPRIS